MVDLFHTDSAREDMLILVDSQDNAIGSATKQQAHEQGLLHRAFSVVLVRQGSATPEILITRRAEGKYHSGGLWTNSCCSHPREGEELLSAAVRRVKEELGAAIDTPTEIGAFVYRADFENGLAEHEFDHVLIAAYAGSLNPNEEEASEALWLTASDLAAEMNAHPTHFTAWAPRVLTMAIEWLEHHAEEVFS